MSTGTSQYCPYQGVYMRAIYSAVEQRQDQIAYLEQLFAEIQNGLIDDLWPDEVMPTILKRLEEFDFFGPHQIAQLESDIENEINRHRHNQELAHKGGGSWGGFTKIEN